MQLKIVVGLALPACAIAAAVSPSPSPTASISVTSSMSSSSMSDSTTTTTTTTMTSTTLSDPVPSPTPSDGASLYGGSCPTPGAYYCMNSTAEELTTAVGVCDVLSVLVENTPCGSGTVCKKRNANDAVIYCVPPDYDLCTGGTSTTNTTGEESSC